MFIIIYIITIINFDIIKSLIEERNNEKYNDL